MKLGHIGLPVADIAKAKVFYDAIASSIGLKQLADHDDFVGYGSEDSYEFYIHTGKAGISGLHVCFEVGSKEDVQTFYDAGLANGGADNGAPGIREDYSGRYPKIGTPFLKSVNNTSESIVPQTAVAIA